MDIESQHERIHFKHAFSVPTITLFINMHGLEHITESDKINRILKTKYDIHFFPLITSVILSGKYGSPSLRQNKTFNVTNVIDEIKQIAEIYDESRDVFENNSIFSEFIENDKKKPHINRKLKFDYFDDLSEKTKTKIYGQHHPPSSEINYLRRLTHDKLFAHEEMCNEKNLYWNLINGIFIINTQYDKELPISHNEIFNNLKMSNFKDEHFIPIWEKDLTNIEVFKSIFGEDQFLSKINITDKDHENLINCRFKDDLTNENNLIEGLYDPSIKYTESYSTKMSELVHVLKYNNILLSKLIFLLNTLGYKHINIIDTSCRVMKIDRRLYASKTVEWDLDEDSTTQQSLSTLRRQHSNNEKDDYKREEKLNITKKSVRVGGAKRKTKRIKRTKRRKNKQYKNIQKL